MDDLKAEVSSRSKPLSGLDENRGHLRRALERLLRKKLAVACLLIIGVIYLAGILAPWIAPYGYNDQDYLHIRESPSLQHWAGTDMKGRDVLSRALWGIQNTVVITVVTMATGGLILGVSLGLISGYFGGKTDSLIMRVGEVFASFPLLSDAETLLSPVVFSDGQCLNPCTSFHP